MERYGYTTSKAYDGAVGAVESNGIAPEAHFIPERRSDPRRRLVRFRPGLLLFLIGLNIYFILPILFPTDYYSGGVSGTMRYHLAAYLCLVFGGLLEVSRLRGGLLNYREFRVWGFALATILILMVLRSVAANEDLVLILLNTIVYGSMIFIPVVGQNDENWLVLNKVFIGQTLLGGTYALWFLLTSGALSRWDIMAFRGYNIILGYSNVIPPLCYAVPFLVLSFPRQSMWGKLAAIFGLIITLLVYFFWQSRIGIIMAAFLVLFMFIIAWRSRQFSLSQIRRGMAALVLFGVLSVLVYTQFLAESDLRSRFEIAQSLTQNRFASDENNVIALLIADPRWEEVRLVAEQLTADEWLFGRGVAATWSDDRADPVNYEGAYQHSMVHVGYMHYIFQGGIVFLAVMMAPLVWGSRAFRLKIDVLGMVAGGLVLLYFVQMIGYGYPTLSLSWALFCLAIGRSVEAKARPG